MAAYTSVPMSIRVTRVRRWLIVAPILGLVLGLLGLAALLFTQAKPATPPMTADQGYAPAYMKKATVYQATPIQTPPVATPAPDPLAGIVRDLQQEMQAMQRGQEALARAIADLRQRPATAPAAAPAHPTSPTPPVKRTVPSMVVMQADASQPPAGPTPTYTLMPGTSIACTLETALNSDVGDTPLVALTTTTVYDTSTGRIPLIPPHSRIVGQAQGSQLLYGNERVRTVSLTLNRRQDREPIPLGEAPITDQAGVAGLTGRVNQHYMRLLGAVLIGGALKGGTQALSTSLAQAGPAGAVGGGVAQSGQQVVQSQSGPALSTRPTITVDGGQLCTVLLLKPLQLTRAE